MDKEKRGCLGCGSVCGMDGCSICEGRVLCLHCEPVVGPFKTERDRIKALRDRTGECA